MKPGSRILITGGAGSCRRYVTAWLLVVYGKPEYSPIDERHPLVVEEARKPLYGIAKAAAEEEIGGKHLREMLRTAAAGDPLEVPGDSGGSFLFLADPWELSDAAARELLGYRPMDPSEAKASLKAAISVCSRAMTGSDAKNL